MIFLAEHVTIQFSKNIKEISNMLRLKLFAPYLSREAKMQFIETEIVRLDSYLLYGQGPSFAQIKSYDTIKYFC